MFPYNISVVHNLPDCHKNGEFSSQTGQKENMKFLSTPNFSDEAYFQLNGNAKTACGFGGRNLLRNNTKRAVTEVRVRHVRPSFNRPNISQWKSEI
jgi:hypothetical protein